MRSAESTSPLTAVEFDRLMAPVSGARRLALAVSGGPDSLALLHLAAGWRATRATPSAIHVLTVDHGLRPGAAVEARAVAGLAAAHGLPCEILAWAGDKPATGIEAAARTARYRLLAAAARRIGAAQLILAHHRDDQAETFLLRLAGGSGVYGLAGMRAAVAAEGVGIFRPFLEIPKSRLAATVRLAGLKAADDESNRDPRFARSRLRRLMPLMAAEGLGADALAVAARRLARAGDALDQLAGRLIGAAISVDELALARIDWPLVAAEPEEIRLRLLHRLIVALGGGPARAVRLEALLADLDEGGDRKRTLGGVVVVRSGREVFAWREWGRAGLPELTLAGPVAGIWDGRFRVDLTADSYDGLRIAGLGAGARRLAAGRGAVSRQAAAAVPALFAGDEVVAAPTLGLAAPAGTEFSVECVLTRALAEPRRFPRFGAPGDDAIHYTD